MAQAGDGLEQLRRIRYRRAWAAISGLTRRSDTRMAASASLLAVFAVLMIGLTSLPHGLLEPVDSTSIARRVILALAVLAFTGTWLAVAVSGYLRQTGVGPAPTSHTADLNRSS